MWFAPRYLLPCTHVMLSQRRAIRETDIYGKSADKFLSLIPECCRLYTASSAERDEEGAFWGKGEQQTLISNKQFTLEAVVVNYGYMNTQNTFFNLLLLF